MLKKAGEAFRLTITVDLETQVTKILNFLEACEEKKEWLHGKPASYNFFIETYLRFIKLKAKYPNRRLIPSLEVEWVWFCMSFGDWRLIVGHVLRPRLYEAFCFKCFETLIPHSLDDWILGTQEPSLLRETASLYEKVMILELLRK